VLVVTAIAVVRLASLWVAVVLFAIYSLTSASLFVTLDAVDVAFTEAAVGAGISTILMMATLRLVGRRESPRRHSSVVPLFVVLVTGGLLIYGTWDLPPFGSPDNPVHQHVAPRYLQEMPREVGVPNVVTAVLASYRGYDTMGEVTVIFTAGVSVFVLLFLARPGSGRGGRK
jgi:multicomponent Na+:H+ antiporter subunit B